MLTSSTKGLKQKRNRAAQVVILTKEIQINHTCNQSTDLLQFGSQVA
jgi:hypothetical protein